MKIDRSAGVWAQWEIEVVERDNPEWKQARCLGDDVDPEWWVQDHLGRSHIRCTHALAAHICRSHCPILELCSTMKSATHGDWLGVVLAGEWIELNPNRADAQRVTPLPSCHICGDHEATRRAVVNTLLQP